MKDSTATRTLESRANKCFHNSHRESPGFDAVNHQLLRRMPYIE